MKSANPARARELILSIGQLILLKIFMRFVRLAKAWAGYQPRACLVCQGARMLLRLMGIKIGGYKMISVFVREVTELEGHKLGEFHPEDLPVVITRFKEYPVYVGLDDDAVPASFLDARFICDEGGAYFEILVEA